MSQRELVYYIDPNSNLYNSRVLISNYVHDYLGGVARMAKPEEYEDLTCLISSPISPRRNKYRFKHINEQVLYNMLVNHSGSKTRAGSEELAECLKMALSNDKEGAIMGAHIIIKSALKDMTITYTDCFICNMACWLVQYKNFNDDFSRIYKLSLREQFQEKVANFLHTILRKDYINKGEKDLINSTYFSSGSAGTKTLVYKLGTIVSDYYKCLEPK